MLDFSVGLLEQNSTGEGQITIEPSMPDAATIALSTDLQISTLGLLGDELELKTRRIGVSTADGESLTWLVFAADDESDQRRLVLGDKILAEFARLPLLA